MKKASSSLLVIFIALSLGLVSCVNSVKDALETAKFFLDNCDPTDANTASSCTSAINEANTILDDAGIANTNVRKIEAAILASSGYLGLAGLDFLQFSAEAADIDADAKDAYVEFRNLVNEVEAANNRAIDLAQLQLAKGPLTTVLGIGTAAEQTGNDDNAAAFFQLGMIFNIDGFVRPSKLAQADIDAGNILTMPGLGGGGGDETEADRAEQDFLIGDNALVSSAAGETLTDEMNDILRPMRENYCRCSLQAPLGGTAGYDAACLRDLQRCELGVDDPDNPPAGDTIGVEQDYDSDGDTDNADCNTLLTPGGLDNCAENNTT